MPAFSIVTFNTVLRTIEAFALTLIVLGWTLTVANSIEKVGA